MIKLRSETVYGALVTIFAIIYSVINIGDYKLGIAQTSSDDGILSGAYISKNPENYLRDASAQSLQVMGRNSIIHELPSWLYKNFDVNPEIFWVILVYFQNMFYVISIYYLARCLSLSKIISCFTVLIAINLRIHTLNLAWIGDLEWMPYGTWIVLPIELISLGLLIQGKTRLSIGLHAIGILIHPTFSLGVTILLLAFVWLKRDYLKDKKYLLLLFAAYVYFFQNYIKTKQLALDKIDENLVKSILSNGHINTLLFDSTNINFEYTTVSAFLLLSLFYLVTLSITEHRKSQKAPLTLMKILSVILILFITGALAAIYFEFVPILQMNLQRFSIIYVIVILIYAIKVLISTKNKEIRFVAAPLYIAIFFTSNLFLHIIISIFWIIYSLQRSRLILIQSQLTLTFQIWILNKRTSEENQDLLTAIRQIGKNFGWESVISAKYSGLMIILLIIATWVVLYAKRCLKSNDKLHKLFSALGVSLVIFLALTVLENRHLDTVNRENVKLKAYADIQNWARENSKPSQYFMVDNLHVYRGWRNATNRPVLSYMNIGNAYVYLKSDKYWSDKYAQFFESNEPYSAQGQVNETQQIKSFGQEFGASFVVWKKEWIPLDLTSIYDNSHYIVYSLEMP
jgi:hypothetical protein